MKPIVLVTAAGFGAGIVGASIVAALLLLLDSQRRVDLLVDEVRGAARSAEEASRQASAIQFDVLRFEGRVAELRSQLEDLRRRVERPASPPPPAPIPPR